MRISGRSSFKKNFGDVMIISEQYELQTVRRSDNVSLDCLKFLVFTEHLTGFNEALMVQKMSITQFEALVI
jgi:hypothetical protein